MKIFPFLIFLFLLSAGAACPMSAAEEKEAVSDPLRQSAAGGDAEAQFKLANEYFYGTPSRKINRVLAAYWYRRAAALNFPQAQFNYGICLEHGLGIDADPAAALEFYTFAAEQGVIPAEFNRAMLILHGSGPDVPEDKSLPADPEAGKKALEVLAKKNMAPAQIELAAILLANLTEKADKDTAFRLLESAADSADATGKGFRLLADCFYGGIGTVKDDKKAVRFLELAAKRNDAESMARLAFFYERGEIVEQDPDKAFGLYRRAAELGFPLAMFKYAEYICEGKEENTGLNAAMKWYEKAATAGNLQAIHRLALFALEGIGRDAPDKPLAAELFLRAARLGHVSSQYNLGCMLSIGDGIPQDDRGAFFWFAQAAKKGHAAAMRRIGLCFYEGKGCPKDNEQAVEWLQYAAEAGDVIAEEMISSGRRGAW